MKVETATERLIAETLRLDGEATQGPWHVQMDGGTIRTTAPHEDGDKGASITTTYFTSVDVEHLVSNAEMIAEYRTSAPRLARMLQVAVERIRLYEQDYFKTSSATIGASATLTEIERIAKEE